MVMVLKDQLLGEKQFPVRPYSDDWTALSIYYLLN